MRNTAILFIVGIIISLSSCRKDFEFTDSHGDLEFSKDTVYLDTVFTNIGSSTYTLKVYNRSDDDIKIPVIQLGKGLGSKYRMTVDGMTGNEGKIFENVELLAKDSMYIFIETTAGIADANPADFLYTDKILFDVGANQQDVDLVTLIQDAVFLFPQRDPDGNYEHININGEPAYGFVLDPADPDHGDEYHFTNEKPYVIYGYAVATQDLVIDPGARIHCHADSGIIVGPGGSIHAGAANDNPAEASEVVFEGDRLEPDFSDIPGQWFGIWFNSGAGESSFDHVTIKNATVGLWVQDNPAGLTLKNTQIYDCSFYGIWGNTATITAENVVINNAGVATFAGIYGGNYSFTHCTINNSWPSSQQVAVFLSDYLEGADPETKPLANATFSNCIIYGSNQIEMLHENNGPAYNFQFNSCLIKFNNFDNQFTNGLLYQFAADPRYNNCYIATNSFEKDPDFWDVSKNNLKIEQTSFAVGKADPTWLIAKDIRGVTRSSGDLGAYQSEAIPDEG